MSTLLSNLRVAVIGGGISGVATAASLLKLGCKRVTVYDKQPSLSALHRAHPPAVVLQANGTRVIDALDVLPVLSTSASAIHRLSQRSVRGSLLWSCKPATFLHTRTRYTSLAASYAALHAALASQLPPDTIQWNRQVAAVERSGSKYSISFVSSTAETDSLRADLVVAADGADSAIRGQWVYGGTASAMPQVMAGRLVEGVSSKGPTGPLENELQEVSASGVRVGAVRLLDGTVYWYAMFSGAYADMTSGPHSLAPALSSLPAWVSTMVAATPTASFVAVPLRHQQPSAPLYRDGVVLVGSSSVLLPPALHQQAASSLESALTLALSLRSSTSIAGGLQRYSTLRAPRLLSLHSASLSECQQTVGGKSALMSSLRRMVSSLLPSQVKDAVQETAIGYDVLKYFPEYREGTARKPKLFGQAGQLLADRLETDLKELEDMELKEWKVSEQSKL